MNKNGAITAIIIWSAVAVFLIAVMVFGIVAGTRVFTLRAGEKHDVFTREENAELIKSINIGWTSGHVTVTPTQENTMRLVQTSRYDVEPLEYDISNGKVTITETMNFGFHFLWFGSSSSDLELSLPVKQYEEFALKMTSGLTDMSGIQAANVKLTLTSGKLNAQDINSDNITVNMTSGDLEAASLKSKSLKVDVTSGQAELGGSFEAINCDTTSGGLDVSSDIAPKKLDARITSGDISVAIPDNDGFVLSSKKTSGSVRSDFSLTNRLDDSDGSYIYGKGAEAGRNYSVKITSGKFELLKR